MVELTKYLSLCSTYIMNFYSTTVISKIYGLTAKPLVFNFLYENNYIYKHKEKPFQRLTHKGLNFGRMFHHKNGEQWIVWNEQSLSPILKEIKWKIMQEHKRQFSLYHMTHINNLASILQRGCLLSHNQVKHYTDISNNSVNNRRTRAEPHFNRSIHEYVPLYINPRNAMLYNVQKAYPDEIVLFKIHNSVCLNPYTLFTYKNAAADDAIFFNDIKEFLDEADWNGINCNTWFDNPIAKKTMMSECLIYNSIPVSYIEAIECKLQSTADKICNILNQYPQLKQIETVYYDSPLFFNFHN